jgi:hypothetical protein
MNADDVRLGPIVEREVLSSTLLRTTIRAAERCFERAHQIGRDIAGNAGTGVVLLSQSEAAALVQALESLAETGHPLDAEQQILLEDLRALALSVG